MHAWMDGSRSTFASYLSGVPAFITLPSEQRRIHSPRVCGQCHIHPTRQRNYVHMARAPDRPWTRTKRGGCISAGMWPSADVRQFPKNVECGHPRVFVANTRACRRRYTSLGDRTSKMRSMSPRIHMAWASSAVMSRTCVGHVTTEKESIVVCTALGYWMVRSGRRMRCEACGMM